MSVCLEKLVIIKSSPRKDYLFLNHAQTPSAVDQVEPSMVVELKETTDIKYGVNTSESCVWDEFKSEQKPELNESRKTMLLSRVYDNESIVPNETLTTSDGYVFTAEYGQWNSESVVEIKQFLDENFITLSPENYKLLPHLGKIITRRRYPLDQVFYISINNQNTLRVGFQITNFSTTEHILINGAGYVYSAGGERLPALSQVPPTISQLKLSPEEPTINSTISVSYKYFDLNRNKESGTIIEWFKNSTPLLEIRNKQSFTNSDLLPANKLKSSSSIYCTVTPSDGVSYGRRYTSPSILIVQTPPALEAPKIIATRNNTVNSRFDTSSVLTASYQFLSTDGSSVVEKNTIIRWFVNGLLFRTQMFSAGDANLRKSLFPAPTVVGKDSSNNDIMQDDSAAFIIGNQIYAEITPRTSNQTGSVIRTEVVTISNSLPVVRNARIQEVAGTFEISYELDDTDIVIGSQEDESEIRWYSATAGVFTEVTSLVNQRSVSKSSFTKGVSIRARISPYDGNEFGSDFTTASIIVI